MPATRTFRPKSTEVIDKIGRDVIENLKLFAEISYIFLYEIPKENFSYIPTGFVKGVKGSLAFPYIAPTVTRCCKEYNKEAEMEYEQLEDRIRNDWMGDCGGLLTENSLHLARKEAEKEYWRFVTGIIFGSGVGITLHLYSVVLAMPYLKENPELAALPIATNIISAIYEKARSKLISESLEHTVSS